MKFTDDHHRALVGVQEDLGFNTQQMAQAVGVASSTMGRWLANRVGYTRAHAMELLVAFLEAHARKEVNGPGQTRLQLVPGLPNIAGAMEALSKELFRGLQLHGHYNSPHEAYAVIQEELDEFWDSVKGDKHGGCDPQELLQVAATALRGFMEFGGKA